MTGNQVLMDTSRLEFAFEFLYYAIEGLKKVTLDRCIHECNIVLISVCRLSIH